jgi:hypothetical protein
VLPSSCDNCVLVSYFCVAHVSVSVVLLSCYMPIGVYAITVIECVPLTVIPNNVYHNAMIKEY